MLIELIIPFESESVWNYELFLRSSLFDNAVFLNGNLFYSDYTDSQRLVPDFIGTVPFGQIVVNAEEATAYGLEVEVAWAVADNLRLTANGSWLETEVGRFTVPAGTTYVGNEFRNSPNYLFGAGVDWELLPGLTFKGNVRHSDGYNSDDENLPPFIVDSYTVANLNLSYAIMESLDLYGYVRNVADDRSPISLYTDRSVGGVVANIVEPRTFGIGLKGAF